MRMRMNMRKKRKKKKKKLKLMRKWLKWIFTTLGSVWKECLTIQMEFQQFLTLKKRKMKWIPY